MNSPTGETIVTATSVSNPEISASCIVKVTSNYVKLNVITHSGGNGIVIGGGTYTNDTEVTLTAIPDDGYRFVQWSDGCTDNPYKFKLDKDVDLTAYFMPNNETLLNGAIVSIPKGNYQIYYTDVQGRKWYLHAAGYNNWAVSETPQIIKFSDGNTSDEQAYAHAASFMESNGYYMSNVEGWDGTGPINTVEVNGDLGLQKRTWESQVFFKNNARKYAIRLTNTVGTDWGCHCFVNIDPITLEISAGQPSLQDALYLWEIESLSNGIETVVTNRLVDVYTLQGVMIKHKIPVEELEQGLPNGIYIANDKKFIVK